MKWVKFKSDLLVEATGKLYKKGEVSEENEEFAKRHGKDGTGIVEETTKPKVQDKELVEQ
ncbi:MULTISPECIES: hypothetical protein [unclassified Pedobacter]|uniref:hypothetical protein n=1 Tax=unclassified Pedobacter TaxID=2628915 RepID=UPI001423AF78|nr:MULTISPECIES: hypothetical protein [unclassified Pedobacter]NII81749.1 hypothetical protein [Pedobacter sp. SG908]NMN35752.1 hypothetical protein [Pedobacter sp. SG918]